MILSVLVVGCEPTPAEQASFDFTHKVDEFIEQNRSIGATKKNLPVLATELFSSKARGYDMTCTEECRKFLWDIVTRRSLLETVSEGKSKKEITKLWADFRFDYKREDSILTRLKDGTYREVLKITYHGLKYYEFEVSCDLETYNIIDAIDNEQLVRKSIEHDKALEALPRNGSNKEFFTAFANLDYQYVQPASFDEDGVGIYIKERYDLFTAFFYQGKYTQWVISSMHSPHSNYRIEGMVSNRIDIPTSDSIAGVTGSDCRLQNLKVVQ